MRVTIYITVCSDDSWVIIGEQQAEIRADNIAMRCMPWEKICAGLAGRAIYQAEVKLQKTQEEVNIDD